MSSPANSDAISGAIVPHAGVLPPDGAPRQVAPVVLSFNAVNYSKWAIYMKAILGRTGFLGHIDGTTPAAPTDAAWSTAYYTTLNVLHSGIDEDVADMILSDN